MSDTTPTPTIDSFIETINKYSNSPSENNKHSFIKQLLKHIFEELNKKQEKRLLYLKILNDLIMQINKINENNNQSQIIILDNLNELCENFFKIIHEKWTAQYPDFHKLQLFAINQYLHNIQEECNSDTLELLIYNKRKMDIITNLLDINWSKKDLNSSNFMIDKKLHDNYNSDNLDKIFLEITSNQEKILIEPQNLKLKELLNSLSLLDISSNFLDMDDRQIDELDHNHLQSGGQLDYTLTYQKYFINLFNKLRTLILVIKFILSNELLLKIKSLSLPDLAEIFQPIDPGIINIILEVLLFDITYINTIKDEDIKKDIKNNIKFN